MSCEYRLQQMAEAARRREEKKRREAIRDIEEALASGQARIVKQPNGKMVIMGVALPTGMMDTCVVAKLQERNSQGFQQAVQKANAVGTNFIHAHNLTHQGGGGRGQGH